MSRDIKRVPLNFDWPMKARWSGYLMPDELREKECNDCSGTGNTPARQHVNGVSEVLLDQANASFINRRRQEGNRTQTTPRTRLISNHVEASIPSEEIEDFVSQLMGEGPVLPLGHGHYGYNDAWKMTKALLSHAGLPQDWGICGTCKGEGIVETWEGKEAAANAWERTDPPKGEGWQMWESTSEGSPISPVFESAAELIDWLVESGASLSGNTKGTHEEWSAITHGTGDVWITLSGGKGPTVEIIEHSSERTD